MQPFFDKALTYQRQGHFPQAITLYRQVLQQVPKHQDSLFNLTFCLIASRRFQEAQAPAGLLSRELPEEPRAWLNLAVVEIGLGDNTKALEHLDKAEELQGPPFEILLNRGVAFGRLDQFETALASYHGAETINQTEPTLLFNLALTYDKAGRGEDALRYYQSYLDNVGPGETGRRNQVATRIIALRRHLAETAAPQPPAQN